MKLSVSTLDIGIVSTLLYMFTFSIILSVFVLPQVLLLK